MNILLADRDPGLGRLLGNMLESDGHRVIFAQEGMAAVAAFRGPAPIGLAILDGQLPVRNGFDLARWLRTAGITIPILITSDRSDDRVREVVAALKIDQLYVRPFDSFALTDRVRELVVVAPEPAPLPTSAGVAGGASAAAPTTVVIENLLLVTKIWQGRMGGTLTVEGRGGRQSCVLGQGAPLDAEGREVVRSALYTGKATFLEHPMEAEGVRSMLAEALYRAALKLQEKLPEDLVLVPRDLSEIDAFPIPLGIQSLLKNAASGGISARCTVGALMARTGQQEELGRAICALMALGFFYVEGKDGRPRHRWQPESPRLGPAPGANPGARPVVPVREASIPPFQPAPVHEVSWSRPPEPARSTPPARSVPPTRPVTSRPPMVDSSIPISASSAGSPSSKAGLSSTPGFRSSNVTERTTEMLGRGRSSVGSALRSALAPDQHRQILQREVQTLSNASPWTILGIPSDSTPDRIQLAGERMRERYLNACRSEDAQVRDLGAQVLARVEWAISNARPVATPVADNRAENIDRIETFEAPGEDEGPFQEGVALASAGKWSAADRQFSKARELDSGSARNLAWLGWSRFQNPAIPLDRREDEGIEYLRLAEQFDSENVESRWFLATILSKRDPDAAIRRLVKVLQLQPDHPEAAGLLRKLKAEKKP